MSKSHLPLWIAFFVTGAIGFLLGQLTSTLSDDSVCDVIETPREIVTVPVGGADAAQVATLSKRNAELEDEINRLKSSRGRGDLKSGRERRADASVSGTQTNNATAERSTREQIRESFAERIERMKTEEPERYAEMQKRKQEISDHMRTENANRYNYFTSIDTGNMTAEQKEAHEQLLEALQMRDEYQDRMYPDAENPLTDKERQQFFQTMHLVGEMMETERRYILEETGKAYGENGGDFADFIQEIFDNTSAGGHNQMMRRRDSGRQRDNERK